MKLVQCNDFIPTIFIKSSLALYIIMYMHIKMYHVMNCMHEIEDILTLYDVYWKHDWLKSNMEWSQYVWCALVI